MNDYLELTQNLELIQIRRRLSYIEALAKLHPEYKSNWQEIGDGFMLYAGPDSPVNRVMGLGLKSKVARSDIQVIEDFYYKLNEPARIDLCPLADESLLEALNHSGYMIEQMDDVLYLRLSGCPANPSPISCRIDQMNDENREKWMEIIAISFSNSKYEYPVNYGITEPSAHSACYTGFLAYLDSEPAGAGGLYAWNNLAEMAPDGTLPPFRKRGIQTALMMHRLDYASRLGCRLVAVVCDPSVSTRKNAENLGFKLAYTKMIMQARLLETKR